MPDKKLTDSEIIKALRSWLEEIRKSRQAYLEKVNEEHYPSMRYEYLLSDTIHEINRLQAENERLKPFEDKIAEFNSHIRVEDMLVFASSLEEWLEFCENLKAEAYKEFAERLKEWLCKENELYISCAKNMLPKEFQKGYEQKNDFVIKLIDNLLKEMVGEKE